MMTAPPSAKQWRTECLSETQPLGRGSEKLQPGHSLSRFLREKRLAFTNANRRIWRGKIDVSTESTQEKKKQKTGWRRGLNSNLRFCSPQIRPFWRVIRSFSGKVNQRTQLGEQMG